MPHNFLFHKFHVEFVQIDFLSHGLEAFQFGSFIFVDDKFDVFFLNIEYLLYLLLVLKECLIQEQKAKELADNKCNTLVTECRLFKPLVHYSYIETSHVDIAYY